MRQRGSLLILSLWVFLLLAMLAAGLAVRGRLEAKITGIRQATGPLPYGFLSAVNYARYQLETDATSDTDTPLDSWYEKQAEVPSLTPVSVEEGAAASPTEANYLLTIRDEESKLNLNSVPPGVLEYFFDSLGHEGIALGSDPEDWIGGILYWRGGSWIKKKAQNDAYYKKAPFESLEELYLIPGIAPEDIAKLLPYFTVFPVGKKQSFKVNVNTAPIVLLEALVTSLPGDLGALRNIMERIIGIRKGLSDDGNRYLSEADMNAQNFLSRIGISANERYLNAAGQLLTYLTVDSEYFTVVAQLASMQHLGVRAVLGPGDQGKEGLKILSWQRL